LNVERAVKQFFQKKRAYEIVIESLLERCWILALEELAESKEVKKKSKKGKGKGKRRSMRASFVTEPPPTLDLALKRELTHSYWVERREKYRDEMTRHRALLKTYSRQVIIGICVLSLVVENVDQCLFVDWQCELEAERGANTG
jgi:hypothetical protein